MATEVKVPSMGESITSGILSAWTVANGEFVSEGQIIYELETDKVTSEAQAEVAGIITLDAAEGDEVEIGQVIASIDESAQAPAGDAAPAKDSPSDSTPAAKEEAPASNDNLSPAPRRIVEETGIDPKSVQGTGKDGRVTKGDLLAASKNHSAAPASTASPAPSSVPASERTTRKKMTPLRRSIAKRLVEAQQTAAILTTFNEVDMTEVMKLRKKLQEDFVGKHEVKLGFMSFFVKATVQALKAVPALNAQIEGDEIIQNNYYDIGVAVSTPKGLMVPVVRDCDQLTYAGVEKSIIDYAYKARDGKIGIDDMQGGVFTITNGGTFGSLLSTPIINPPQSGILGMHTIQQRPVAVNGQVEIRPMMYLAVSYDHRIVDGKEAVTFLVKIKEAIEDPTRLLFDL